MLIPIGIDKPLRRRPIVTEALVVLNLVAFLACLMGPTFEWYTREQFTALFGFNAAGLTPMDVIAHPIDNAAWGLLTYQFVHDPYGIFHILFNLLFLWVFGRAVETRFRPAGFLAFYLMAGIISAFGHMIVEKNGGLLIGASGSICGVTGAFAALFPRTRVRVLFFFFFIGILELPSLFLIGLFFALDFIRGGLNVFGSGGDNIAYMAHLAGSFFGFALAVTLLATRVLKREEFDIFFLFKQSRRRAAMRAATRQSGGASWDARASVAPQQQHRPAKPVREFREPTEAERKLAAVRADIGRLVSDHKLEEAAHRYVASLDQMPELVLADRAQLDVANQLFAMDQHDAAARAYELYLKQFGSSDRAGEVNLLLGVLYTRQLDKPSRAREVIALAKQKLRDASQVALANQLESELQAG